MKLDKYAVGQRYAKALLSLAEQEQQFESIHEEIQALETIFNGNPKLGAVLTDTTLSGLKRRELLKKLVGEFSTLMQHFLSLVFDYQRMAEMPYIIAAYEDLYDHKMGIAHAKVTSAVALDDEQITKISQSFAKREGLNRVLVESVIDPDIIGGIVLESNHKVIDGSIKHGLEQIKALLLK
ncbi:ATP synthase F1 subunit delta [Latilactobacillus graminis]|uniref:ATP synthase subunit delta n=2 Tax=Latilactobacillus graminis TaxID=60519 RepID=A0AA89I298_9LACO|nr:ATP synthase F1 subunit delta [Latilactobacillus graminis]KRM22368.1 ATP synthase F1, delta subunit [Latilactobacillus graminis DSM 20719]QFP79458.1 F0F1 ATP synthase subunit delta [Latilactobacillus graminis]